MNRAEHILTILGEEGAEIAQRVSKALRFGLGEVQPGQQGQPFDNAMRIREEMHDAISMYLWAAEEGLVPPLMFNVTDPTFIAATKRAKVERFFEISREQGTLDA